MERLGQRVTDQRRWVLDAYVVLVTGVLVWPLVSGRGYPVARDMVFTPRIPLRPEAVGVGSGAPRAVPLDAVMAVLTMAVDGGVLAKILVPLPLLLAGWGAHRLLPGAVLPARAAMAALAVWNPFVVERLGLGQWALLYGYAAVIHVVRLAVCRSSRSAGPAATAPWLALGALTPTGALLTGGAAVILSVRRRSFGWVLVLSLIVQLPWVVPGLLGAATLTSDPAGVAAFAARGERAGGPLWSLVGLGGIWDGLSVPGTRSGALGHITSALVVIVLASAWRLGGVPRRLWVLGAGSLLLASLSSFPGGERLLEWAVAVVPGAGLLRDAQKWIVPFVVLVVLASGIATDAFVRWCRRRAPVAAVSVAGLGIVAPLLLLPDGAVVVHQVVRPVTYPGDYRGVAEKVDGTNSLLVPLPWRLYRHFEWSGPYSAYDPSSRWFDVRVITADALVLGDRTVSGEDPLAVALAQAAESRDLAGLRSQGVRFVLFHGGLPEDARTLSNGSIAYEGETLTLVDLGQAPDTVDHVSGTWSGRASVVLFMDAMIGLGLAAVSLRNVLVQRRRSATLR